MVATGGKPLRPAHRDLVEETWPATLYLIVPPSDISQYQTAGSLDPQTGSTGASLEELQKAAAIGCC